MSEEIKIDDGIPIPPRYGFKKPNFPFADMKIGQSFYVEDLKASAMNQHITRFKMANPTFFFRCKSDAKGVRVWRIEEGQ